MTRTISRRALARARGVSTASQARADRRGSGLTPIHVSKVHVVYDAREVAAVLEAAGLRWVDGTIRPLTAAPAAPEKTPAVFRPKEENTPCPR